MTTVKITFIEDGKIIDYTYRNAQSVRQNGDITVIVFKEDSEIMTATFYTKQVISLDIE